MTGIHRMRGPAECPFHKRVVERAAHAGVPEGWGNDPEAGDPLAPSYFAERQTDQPPRARYGSL